MSGLGFGLMGVVGVAAVVQDVRSREISNWTTGFAALAGLALGGYEGGWAGLGRAAGGLAIGFLVFFAAYLMNWRGGGDIKLMAGFGALLGTGRVWHAVFLSMVLGGVFAVGYLGWRRLRKGDESAMPGGPSIAIAALLAGLLDG